MRAFVYKHGKKNYKFTATFAASLRLAEEVADPMTISREQAAAAMAQLEGFSYKPSWELTTENTAKILYIGLSETDSTITEEAVQELVFDIGLNEALVLVFRYIALFVDPHSEKAFKQAEGGASASEGKP